MEKKSCLSFGEIEERLKEAGVSPTAQRIAICRYVLCEASHPTAEHVKKWVDGHFPKMSMATVYNTLGILVKAGLLKEIRLPHLDSAVYDQNVQRHFHFVDERTGAISDIHESRLTLSHDLDRDFRINEIEVVVRGRRQK